MDVTAYPFFKTLIPPSWSISGVVLKPFCLGHWIILELIESPFLSKEPVQLTDDEVYLHFFLFLFVCSHSYEDNLQLLSDAADFEQEKQHFDENLKKAIAADPQWNIYNKVKQIEEFLNYFVKMPVFEKKTPDQLESGIDWKQNIYTIFKNEYGYDESTIFNMPIRRLFAEWCCFAESQGSIKVSNSYELEALRAQGVKV